MAHVAVPVSAAAKVLNKKDKRAVAAATTVRKGNPGGAPRKGAPWPLLPGSELASTFIGHKQQVERIKNARENNAKRLNVKNPPICSAVAMYEES
eukprot:4443362-Pleurochrysis_carterae.AAC.1